MLRKFTPLILHLMRHDVFISVLPVNPYSTLSQPFSEPECTGTVLGMGELYCIFVPHNQPGPKQHPVLLVLSYHWFSPSNIFNFFFMYELLI